MDKRIDMFVPITIDGVSIETPTLLYCIHLVSPSQTVSQYGYVVVYEDLTGKSNSSRSSKTSYTTTTIILRNLNRVF